MMAPFNVSRTEIVNFFLPPHIEFLLIFGQCRDNVNKMCFRKVGVTERPRSLSPGKAIAMAICPIIVHFYHLARWFDNLEESFFYNEVQFKKF